MGDAVLEQERGQASSGFVARRPREIVHRPVAQLVPARRESRRIGALVREVEHLLRPLQPRCYVFRRPSAGIF